MGSYGNERDTKLYPGPLTLRNSFEMHRTPAHAGLASSPVEHLLVATDFTECSDCAIERAVECGTALRAQVTVLHVVESGLPRRISKRRQHEAREFLTNHVRKLSADSHSDISINVRIGDSYLEIIREAIELGSDTIILGLDGQGGFCGTPTASTAAAVVRYCHKPVLLVTRRPVGPYRRSVVDVSMAPQWTASAAYRVAPAADPHFVLVRSRSATGPGESKEGPGAAQWKQLRRIIHERHIPYCDSHSIPVNIVQASGDPIEALLNRVDQVSADLLVLSSEGELQEDCEHQGGLVQELSAAPRCDLLMVPGQ